MCYNIEKLRKQQKHYSEMINLLGKVDKTLTNEIGGNKRYSTTFNISI